MPEDKLNGRYVKPFGRKVGNIIEREKMIQINRKLFSITQSCKASILSN